VLVLEYGCSAFWPQHRRRRGVALTLGDQQVRARYSVQAVDRDEHIGVGDDAAVAVIASFLELGSAAAKAPCDAASDTSAFTVGSVRYYYRV
jgi:hypothetical protein